MQVAVKISFRSLQTITVALSLSSPLFMCLYSKLVSECWDEMKRPLRESHYHATAVDAAGGGGKNI